jgi:hypothetical protein
MALGVEAWVLRLGFPFSGVGFPSLPNHISPLRLFKKFGNISFVRYPDLQKALKILVLISLL